MPFKIFVLYYYIQILKKCQYRLQYAIFNNAAVGKNGSRAYLKILANGQAEGIL